MTVGKAPQKRRSRGFKRAATLVETDVRRAGESRGFAVSRLLTHWAEIVGPDVAAAARPVEVSYGRGFGATLTVLTTGSRAPILEMQKEQIREKVNACYGYAAISRIRLTQTAPTGFADGQADFAPKAPETVRTAPDITPEARRLAADVSDRDLRAALERLGANIQSRRKA